MQTIIRPWMHTMNVVHEEHICRPATPAPEPELYQAPEPDPAPPQVASVPSPPATAFWLSGETCD